MSSEDPYSKSIRGQINKRLTLNFLIQGAAGHLMLTAHHAVKAELELLDQEMVAVYDRFIMSSYLGYWMGSIRLIMGNPTRFWKTLHRPSHPFYFHHFLRKYGNELAMDARKDLLRRCKAKGVRRSGFINEIAVVSAFTKLQQLEASHAAAIERIQKQLCSDILGIDISKLDASLTNNTEWGFVREPKTWRGRLIKSMMIGWGGVENDNGELKVVAKAVVGPLVFHELVKGSVELICLHGCNDLPDDIYKIVMDETEHVEYEIPMLQMGPEFYRRFLAVVPREIPLAKCIMHVSQMEPTALDQFLIRMVETPEISTDILRSIEASF